MSLQGLVHLNMAPMTFRISKTFSIGCLPLVSQLPIGPDLSVYSLPTYLPKTPNLSGSQLNY